MFLFFPGDRKSKIADDDSDRGSEASAGSRLKKSNGRAIVLAPKVREAKRKLLK